MATLEAAPRQGGWYHGWNVVAAAWLACIMALGLPLSSVTMFLADWSHDFQAPVSEVLFGLLPSTIVIALFAPFVGGLADKRPARVIFAIGLLAAGASQIAISYVNSVHMFWLVYATLVPLAVSFGSVIPANAIVSRWFVRRIGLALGIVAGTYGAAAIVLPPIVSAVMPLVGWRWVWRGAGLITILLILPLVISQLRNAPGAHDDLSYTAGAGGQSGGGAHGGHGGGHGGGSGSASWKQILGASSFWILLVSFMPIAGLGSGMQNLLGPIVASHGLSTSATGLLLSLFAGVGVVITILMGLAADRFGAWWPMAVLGVLVAVGSALMGFGGSLPAIVVGAALAGSGAAIWPLIASACAAEFGAGSVGRAYGGLTFFTPLLSVEAILAARSAEVSGSYTVPVLIMAALALVGAAIALFLRALRRPQSGVGTAAPA